MRIEVAAQTGHSVPQFVVHAENATDRAVLGCFVDYGRNAPRPVRFWQHGSTYSCDVSGVTSFNFGYIFEDSIKRPTLRQSLRRWWNR